jgi:hypothetical protein
MCLCKVAYCRFNKTHVTKGHKCGRCKRYGHGDAECNNIRAIQNLRQYDEDVMPNNKICSVPDCRYYELHSTEAHHCPECQKREAHAESECPKNKPNTAIQNIYNVKCPVCRADNPVVSTKKILGLTDTCCICMDNNVEILLPSCYHCCICLQCLLKT